MILERPQLACTPLSPLNRVSCSEVFSWDLRTLF
jgi:hypothetical protein